ncbi:MAG TPA: ABC transporter permease [Gemmatimonadaceae bacterium]|nr:ABC transporter permease [Gemmatimonadaceae bacterium]
MTTTAELRVNPYEHGRWWMLRLYDNRELLYTLVWRELKIRYKQSVMGAAWALLMPMLIVAAGVTVRIAMAISAGKPVAWQDATSVAVRGVPWAFLVAAIRFSSVSLISNANLVTKVYLTREVFPIASVLAQFADFLLSTAVLFILLFATGTRPEWLWFWLPVLIAQLLMITAGAGMLLSAASLFFRDVKYLVEVIMTFGIFFTPVFLEAHDFGRWQKSVMLNPVAPIFQGIGDVIVHHQAPDPLWTLYSTAWAIGLLAIAGPVFDAAEPYFAESI